MQRNAAPARFIFLLLLMSLVGCGHIGDQKRSIALDDALKTYRKFIRWGYFNDAATFIRKRDDEAGPINLKASKEVRVTRYDVISSTPLNDDATEVRVVALIDAYSTGSGVVTTLQDPQLWYFDEEDRKWYLDGNLPDFSDL